MSFNDKVIIKVEGSNYKKLKDKKIKYKISENRKRKPNNEAKKGEMTRKPRDEMVLESGTHNNLLPGLIRCIQSRGPDEGDPNVSQPQQSPLKNLHQCAHPTPHHTIPRPFAPSPPSKPDLTPQNLITGSHFT